VYCPNCGNEISDADAFCQSCRYSVEIGSKAKKQITFNKKSIFILLGIIAVVVLIFMVWQANSVNASPENVAIAVVTSEYEADIDLMIKCFPDFTIRELAWEYGLPSNASRSDVKKELKKEYRYTESYKVSNAKAEVLGIYSMDEITIYRELYDDMTDEEYKKITAIAKVKVTFRVDGEAEDVQLTCIKMKGKWYLLRR